MRAPTHFGAHHAHDVGGAIPAGTLEPDGDRVFVELFQTLICDRRSSQIAADPLQSISFVGGDRDGGMQIVAFRLGTQS